MSFTFSALADLLANSFSMYKDDEFPITGNYYFNEIKSAKYSGHCITVKIASLQVLEDKVDGFTILEKKKVIVRALKDFARRNIPGTDTEMFCNSMRWKIE